MEISDYKIGVYYFSSPVKAKGISNIFIYKDLSSACVLLDVVNNIYVEYELYGYIKHGFPSPGISGLFFIDNFTRVDYDREIKYLLRTISYLESNLSRPVAYVIEPTPLSKLIEVYNSVLNRYIFET